MSTIFGYPTIEAEVVSLINAKNANYGSAFTPEQLSLAYYEYDGIDRRQSLLVKDLSNRYFGQQTVNYFKRDFGVLFKGIPIHIQVDSGLKNRNVLDVLAKTYGLPPFADSDFAPGLLDLNIDVGDTEELINWPFADTSLAWTGTCSFYLRNSKSSLTTLIPDGKINRFKPEALSGIFNDLKDTTMSGLDYPTYFDLEEIAPTSELEGLEYPNTIDLDLIIHTTELEGLEYPPMMDISQFPNTELSGLDYPPNVDIGSISTFDMNGLEYPSGTGTSKRSAYTATFPLDFSDYQLAIRRFRVGDRITDVNLVNVIVSLIQNNWAGHTGEEAKSKLYVSFLNATVSAITQKRSVHGWTVSVKLTLSSQAYIQGTAVLRYDIEAVS